ncbi:MAG TPA: ABC transporter ATP-binding protein [Syntrophorhabdaceae bacterium]|nr:ABC transporter ATP-binding protein [Syntrophorhabdaceae bacterium]HPP06527.1 ABC transporter ATP-binding protein [Syntrophorhabdaceae bacterium]
MFLDVKDISISYGDIYAVQHVSFYMEKGELVSIIGANGAGKTTIINSLMGLVPVQSGTIIFKGQDITKMPAHKRAQIGIRIVPERARVFPRLSVYENLLTGMYGMKDKVSPQKAISRLYDIFPVLKERENQLASTLSGGEQQQLAIARALVSEPELLLVDEVSTGLMPKLTQEVFSVLATLNREHELTILLVEQNAFASLEISTRGYVIETGQCVLSGTTSFLMDNARVKEVYLGH